MLVWETWLYLREWNTDWMEYSVSIKAQNLKRMGKLKKQEDPLPLSLGNRWKCITPVWNQECWYKDCRSDRLQHIPLIFFLMFIFQKGREREKETEEEREHAHNWGKSRDRKGDRIWGTPWAISTEPDRGLNSQQQRIVVQMLSLVYW